MSAKFIQKGNTLSIPSATAVANDRMIILGTRVAISQVSIPAGGSGAVKISGVFAYAKLSADVVTLGQALFYDSANDRLTTTAGTNTAAGFAVAAAAAGVTTVQVMLNGLPG